VSRREEREAAREDVDAEVRAHLEARTEALVALGVEPDAARIQALGEFGDVEDARRYMARLAARSEARRRRAGALEELLLDVRLALRRLRAAPGFALTGALTFALGIGATTAIVSVAYGVLLRPLPFPEPERLYAVYHANRAGDHMRAGVSAVDLDDWRAARRDVAELGGCWFREGSSGVDLTGRGDPRRLSAVFVTPGFFETLGVRPAAGRLPREDELVRGGDDRIALLSHGFWQQEFGGSAGVLGKTLTLDGAPVEVIGVLPASLRYPSGHADVYLSYSSIPDDSIPRIRQVRILDVVARARPGVSREAVAAELTATAARLAREYPENRNWDAATVLPLANVIVEPVRDALLVLLGAVALLLLMASVNVATLQLAHASGRHREMALRLALGARRARLLRQLLTESLVLAGIGCLAGVVVAWAGLGALLRLAAGQLPRAAEVKLDATSIGVAVAVTAIAGLLSGLAPALRALAHDPQRALGTGGRGSVGGPAERVRSGLVVAEVAVAVMLVVGAGLMARSFAALLRVDPGFRPGNLVAIQFTLDPERHTDPAQPDASYLSDYRRAIDAVRELPGVVSAGAVKDAPFRGNGERIGGFGFAGRPIPAGGEPPTATAIHVSDGYFATIGARLVAGREYTPRDRAGAPLVLVVNEAFERRYFPGESAVGQRLELGEVSAEIVGVVADIRQVAPNQPAEPTLYISNMQNGRVQTTLVARTQGEPLRLVPALREVVRRLDPDQPITAVFTFDQELSRALARPRLLLVLLGSFGALGLALGALGIYGVVAALVDQRRNEIGLRMALGALPSDVQGMVVGRGLALAALGVGLGLAGAWGLGRFLTAVLYGIEPTDPATLASVAAVLVGAAALASWLPARRAARLDPVEALRVE